MSDDDESKKRREVYNHFLELSKPTAEDFKRVFTEDELKELCLRHKCTVDIWRWNVVNDYRILFTQSGRYQRWSERDRLRMLAKAVNKIRPAVYSEEEIRTTRWEEWGLQLKENILSLNFWKRQRQKNQSPAVQETDDVAKELQSQYEVNTESMNMAELLTQSENVPSSACGHPNAKHTQQLQDSFENILGNKQTEEEIQSQLEVNTESMDDGEINSCVSQKLTPKMHAEDEDSKILLGDDEADFSSDMSQDSVETVVLSERIKRKVSKTLNSEEVAPEIAVIYGVDTESMTFDSQMTTQSQNMEMLQSQDVIPPNYDNFKNVIPLTSTQSQSQETE